MRRRWALGVAAAAVLLAAVDTYVIVLALPSIMADVGVGLERLQAGTPIISGFLLGYIVVMPVLGRLSDTYGRRPLLLLCLTLFAAGSLVTASAHDLGSAVAGRALQGLGGGGLVPVTLALVADLWPPGSRGIPLGIVGGVQELGSVLGPLYGGALLAVSTWRTIFWLNLPLAAVLAAGILAPFGAGARVTARARRAEGHDAVGGALATAAVVAGILAIVAPDPLRDDATLGTLFAPIGPASLTPLSVAAVAASLGFCAWEVRAHGRRPTLVSLPALRDLARRGDWAGSALLSFALAAVVVVFASGDPSREVLSPNALWALPAAAAAAAGFVLRERSARAPLIAMGDFRARAAYGSMLTNVAAGAALIAALVDVPIFARTTAFTDSQLGAALVLLRFLIGIPLGAVLGGFALRRAGNRMVAAVGLMVAAASLLAMTRWTATTLTTPLVAGWLHAADFELVAGGLGFGLAIAPLNDAMLGAVRPAVHGLGSALVVVARMVGMVVGISVLTAVGLHAFYTSTASLPSAQILCPRTPLRCPAFDALVQRAVLDELHTVFLGAAAAAAAGAVLALTLLGGRSGRHAPHRDE
ncbi:MAG: MFS transporter [Chloroflexi bacterium]|nr:MAG: MFS transporter [Chloroflexota bacterium]